MKFFNICRYGVFNLLLQFTLIVIITGCGSFTKMRYSPGYKCNIELNHAKKEKKEENIAASKAIKRQMSGIAQTSETVKSFTPEQSSSDDIPQNIPGLNRVITPSVTGTKVISKFSPQKNLNTLHPAMIKSVPALPESFNDFGDPKPPYEKNSKWAMILFFLSIPGSFIYIGGLLLIVAFILAIIGRRKIKRSQEPLRGLKMDNAIIILFIIFSILGLILLYLFLLWFPYIFII